MSKLTADQRHHMPKTEFALSDGRFPINDASHAQDAIAMASRSEHAGNINAAEADEVRRKARAKLKHPRFGH